MDVRFPRRLDPPKTSFFLFGPRSVGKSYWVKEHFEDALIFDLLDHRLSLDLSRNPGLLEAKIGDRPKGTWICLDEIQKIPALLGEVHRLIENRRYRFALTSSSARKLKRGGADLLAGRAITRHMEGLMYSEMENAFNLDQVLQWGTLPMIVAFANDKAHVADTLSAYVHTYIREEIKEEGLVRKTEPFIRFLEIAALMNGQELNKENVARDAHVPRSTVDVYFSILEDTLLGHFLPAYRAEAKVREKSHPKFYWFDSGVARSAASLLYDPVDSAWEGRALETYVFHELRVFNHLKAKHRRISYYQTGAGAEIDFVVETVRRTASTKAHLVCIEVKRAKRWKREWERPMRSLRASGTVILDRMIGVYCGSETLTFDGFKVLPVKAFLEALNAGEVF
jgi:predicted AAA+ superfamily ATPase